MPIQKQIAQRPPAERNDQSNANNADDVESVPPRKENAVDRGGRNGQQFDRMYHSEPHR
jgi:hypothetical protein